MINVLIADDHKIMVDGLLHILEGDPEINIVGIAFNGAEVLAILENTKADIVLLDIDMPVMNGIECARTIIETYPDIKTTILTMHQENALIRRFIEMGVKGYMLKTIPAHELLFAVKLIYRGGEYFNSDVTRELLDPSPAKPLISEISPLVNQLTSREKEIIKLICDGNSNTQIGKKLFISPKTVDNHRTNIMGKLNLHNVAALVRFAFQNGLLDEK
ncbi:MAG: response regulator transcription factor [Bacteroidetes bacterium]|nr:response regulator transcription factor [Bacteroidota bacterium]